VGGERPAVFCQIFSGLQTRTPFFSSVSNAAIPDFLSVQFRRQLPGGFSRGDFLAATASVPNLRSHFATSKFPFHFQQVENRNPTESVSDSFDRLIYPLCFCFTENHQIPVRHKGRAVWKKVNNAGLDFLNGNFSGNISCHGKKCGAGGDRLSVFRDALPIPHGLFFIAGFRKRSKYQIQGRREAER